MPELTPETAAREPPPQPEDTIETPRPSTALTKIAERSLAVDPREIDHFQPRELDIKIAECLLAGKLTWTQIAQELSVSNPTISSRMKDPLVCAWISRTVHRNIAHRLGMVDAAILNRAIAGNVNAAKLLYDRYGRMVQRSLNVSVSGNLDFSKFDDADLDAFIEDAKKQKVIDVEARPSEEDPVPGGAGGEEEA